MTIQIGPFLAGVAFAIFMVLLSALASVFFWPLGILMFVGGALGTRKKVGWFWGGFVSGGICGSAFLAWSCLPNFPAAYSITYRHSDEMTVRSQLHIPQNVRLVSLDASPKSSGWFGREGLNIEAVFQFDETQYALYLDTTRESWRPTPFQHYLPAIGQEYSTLALAWQDRPLPTCAQRFSSALRSRMDMKDVNAGRYYCSVIAAQDTQWVGRSCCEMKDGQSAVISVFAVIDPGTKELKARIKFSG